MSATDRAAAAQPLWALVRPARPRALPAPRGQGGARRARRARRPARRRGRPAAQRGDARRAAAVRRRAARARDRRPAARSPTAGSGRSPRCAPGAAPRSSRRRSASSASTCATARPGPGRCSRSRAALLAGNAVLLAPAAPRAAARMQNAFIRAGLPEELFQLVGRGRARAGAARVVTLDPPPAKGTMLVLDGAPLDRVVTGAVWAAFAGGGRRHAAVGRAIAVRPQALAAGRRDRGCRAAAARRRPAPARHRGRPARERRRPRPRRGARRRGRGRRRDAPVRRPRRGAAASPARSTRRRSCAACRPTPRCCTSRSPAPCSRSWRPPTRRRRSRWPPGTDGHALGLDRRPRARRARRPRARRGHRLDQRARRRVAGRAGAARQVRRLAPARVPADPPALGPLAAVRPGAAARRDRVGAAAARARVRALGALRAARSARPHGGAARREALGLSGAGGVRTGSGAGVTRAARRSRRRC